MHLVDWIVLLAGVGLLALLIKLFAPYLDDSWLDPRRQAHRLTELSIRAATSGLQESGETAVGVSRLAPEGKKATISFAGVYQGRRVAVGEYRHLPDGRRLGRRKKHRQVKYSAVVSVQLERSQPAIVVVRRDIDAQLWNTMADKAPTGSDTPALGQRRFDDAFEISTSDPQRVGRVLHPKLVRAMLRHKSVQAWIIAGHDLLGVRHEQLDPHSLMPKIGSIRLVADTLEHPGTDRNARSAARSG